MGRCEVLGGVLTRVVAQTCAGVGGQASHTAAGQYGGWVNRHDCVCCLGGALARTVTGFVIVGARVESKALALLTCQAC